MTNRAMLSKLDSLIKDLTQLKESIEVRNLESGVSPSRDTIESQNINTEHGESICPKCHGNNPDCQWNISGSNCEDGEI